MGVPTLQADLTFYASNTSIVKTSGTNFAWRNGYWTNDVGTNPTVSFSIDPATSESDSYIGFVGNGYQTAGSSYSNLLAGFWFSSQTTVYLIRDGTFPSSTAISSVTTATRFRISITGTTAYFYQDDTLLLSVSLTSATGVNIGDPLYLTAGFKFVGMAFYNIGSSASGSSGINATATTASQTSYVVGVNAAGSAQTPFVSTTNAVYFNPSLGYLYAVAMQATSDESQKKNVVTIENALDKVTKLRGVDFEWIQNNIKGSGVIAQEAEKIVPHLVHTNPETGLKSFNYDGLIGILIESIKELKAEIDQLKK